MIALHKLFESGFTKSGRFMPNTASLAQQSKRKPNMVIKDPNQSQTRHKKFQMKKYVPTRSSNLGKFRKTRKMFGGRSQLPGYSKQF